MTCQLWLLNVDDRPYSVSTKCVICKHLFILTVILLIGISISRLNPGYVHHA